MYLYPTYKYSQTLISTPAHRSGPEKNSKRTGKNLKISRKNRVADCWRTVADYDVNKMKKIREQKK